MFALHHRNVATAMACIVLLAAVIFAGCEGDPSAPATGATIKPSVRSSVALSLNQPASADVGGLHIQLLGVLDGDPPMLIPNQGISCGNSLVLATTKLSYTPAEIQQMATYVSAYSARTLGTQAQYSVPEPSPAGLAVPGTLSWIQGWSGKRLCRGGLQITNTGHSAVQIDRVGVELTANPVQSAYAYRQISLCSIVRSACGPGGGASPPCEYLAAITVTDGSAGHRVEGNLTGIPARPFGAPCPMPLTLQPRQTAEVDFSLIPGASGSRIYQVNPYLKVTTSSGAQTIQLAHAANALVFPDPHQFSCYTLHGTQFVLAPPSQTSLPGGLPLECV